MSIESLNEDLTQLERDVRALVKEHASSRDTDAAQLITEEVAAAEFVAAESVIEQANGWLAALGEIGDIQREQLKTLIADHRESLDALTRSRSPIELMELAYQHWRRRTNHVLDGLGKTFDVLARQGQRMSASSRELWQPVVQLVRADWTRR